MSYLSVLVAWLLACMCWPSVEGGQFKEHIVWWAGCAGGGLPSEKGSPGPGLQEVRCVCRDGGGSHPWGKEQGGRRCRGGSGASLGLCCCFSRVWSRLMTWLARVSAKRAQHDSGYEGWGWRAASTWHVPGVKSPAQLLWLVMSSEKEPFSSYGFTLLRRRLRCWPSARWLVSFPLTWPRQCWRGFSPSFAFGSLLDLWEKIRVICASSIYL